MRIREYWRILRRRAWVPLGLMLAAGLAMGLVTAASKPQYVATATVIANSTGSGTDKVLSFQQVATSNTVALQVREELRLSETAASLINHTKVTGDQSNLYRISVTDPDEDAAVKEANAIAEQAAALYTRLAAGTDLLQKLDDDEALYRGRWEYATINLLSFRAQHPDAEHSQDNAIQGQSIRLQLDQQAAEQAYLGFQTEAIKARIATTTNAQNLEARVVDQATAKPDVLTRLLNVLYAAALGLAVGTGIVLAFEYLDDGIRLPEEAEELVGASVIGVIPRVDTRTLRTAGHRSR